MERLYEWQIDNESAGERLDRFVAQRVPDRSRAQIQELIRTGRVRVDGRVVKPSYRLESGDQVMAEVPPLEPVTLKPQPIPLDIVYEDGDVLVVNKPPGLVVHPAPGHEEGTLVNALLAYDPELARAGTERPGIVHRLDKGTSGLIIVARHPAALHYLQRAFAERKVEKVYLALVEGHLQPPQGLIDAPVGRDPRNRKKMAVLAKGGRPAQTAYRVLELLDEYTLIEVQPLTGRTHQIRVHLAALGHPVAGDRVYGRRRQHLELERPFLHAWQLRLKLPSGVEHTFVAPLPSDLRRVLRTLNAEALAWLEEQEGLR